MKNSSPKLLTLPTRPTASRGARGVWSSSLAERKRFLTPATSGSRVEHVPVPEPAKRQVHHWPVCLASVGAAAVHHTDVVDDHRAERRARVGVRRWSGQVGLDVRGELELGGAVTLGEDTERHEDGDRVRRQVLPACVAGRWAGVAGG